MKASDELKTKIGEILQLDEIKEHKARFASILIFLAVAIVLALTDSDDGEVVISDETPTVDQPAEEQTASTTNATTRVSESDIKIVIGANSNDLYIHDPFEELIEDDPVEVETPPTVQIFSPPPVMPTVPTTPPPNVEPTKKSTEKFILRGIAIGENPTALVEKTSDDDNKRSTENIIYGIGDIFNGRVIVAITKDFIIFEDGERMYINTEMTKR